MPPTPRRPRVVDTSMHFCPHLRCDYRGGLGMGNLRANGHPSGGLWRQFRCTSCKGYFLESQGTIFHIDSLRPLAPPAAASGQRLHAQGALDAPARVLYAQVVKSYRRWRLVGVKHRIVFGPPLAIAQVLTACGWRINTAFVERLNLDLRQRVAAGGRRGNTLCQGEDGLPHQLALFQSYYNFCLPHASVRQPLLIPAPTKGSGAAKRWRPGTPAMAAGLTERGWTWREVLLLRVPPWPQTQRV
jgi:hypothetical protein